MTGALAVAAAALVVATLGRPADAAPPTCVREGRYAMGTVLQLQLCGDDAAALRGLAREAFAEVEREEALFSGHRTDSAVADLARHAGGEPVAVPADLRRILAEARRLGVATRGTFDVTVGPLVALWRSAEVPPSAVAIERARAQTGLDRIELRPDGRVRLERPGMSVDLGGIAKGYALDRVREHLVARGEVAAALLEFGSSSVRTIGAPPDGSTWNLVLRAPDGAPLAVLGLRDQALSVSATFGSVREIAGRRYGHVIDPRDGRPLERELVGAVVAADATTAEALSKALLVLADEGVALVESMPAAEAILFEPGRPPRRTSGWDAAVAPDRKSSARLTAAAH